MKTTIKSILTIVFMSVAVLASAQNSNDEVMTNESVINLYKRGLSPSIIVSKIKTSKSNYNVSTDALIAMNNQNIPDDIVNAMVEASGNKESIVGDVNDPNAVHESGIYYLRTTTDGNTEMIQLEPTVCTQTKMGSGLASAMTYGAASTKMKAKIDGEMSRLQFEDQKPVFYFYFDKGANLNTTSTWFSPSSSPNEFVLAKMTAKQKAREFITGKMNVWSGSNFGVDEKIKVAFDIEKIKPGVYKVTAQIPLVPGEYCFMFAGNATMYGSTGQKVFDFGIK